MYNVNEYDFKLGFIYFLILFFLLIICKNITNKSKEGFSASDITNITGTVNNIASKATEIPGKITAIGTQIAGAATNITNTVNTKIGEAETRVEGKIMSKVDTVVSKFKTEVIDPIKTEVSEAKEKIRGILAEIASIFEQLAGIPDLIRDKIEKKVEWLKTKIKRFGENIGDLVKGGLVDPFMTLFKAMGHMFVMTGKIAMKVIGKIKSLPNCSILYMFNTVFAAVNTVYKWIMPGFVVTFLSTMYGYTLKTPLEYISCWVGLTEWWNKCLSFNVDAETNSIIKKFNQVGPAFKDTFGNMDFKDLFDLSDDQQEEKKRATQARKDADAKAEAEDEAELLAQEELDNSWETLLTNT
jgi:hypothetical protein